MASESRGGRKWGWAGIAVAILLMIVLRCVALDSDAYPRLSWSSALLTDEGFYLHNARNQILFGHPQTDQFNNRLIMPLLNLVQVGVFHLVGVSAVSARAISVVLGLLTLPVFFDAMRRAFGLRPAVLGLLLLGLDHVSLLYSRLALMDTPAAFVLVCAFWLWVKSGEDEDYLLVSNGKCERMRRSRIWLLLCGMVLGSCYSVRGLGALVFPIPIVLLAWMGWKAKRRVDLWQGPGKGEWIAGLASFLGGLVLTLGIYGVVWYLPNRAELARVNHYYLFDQLIPHRMGIFLANWRTGLFGDHRGLMPYLFRHEPIQTLLVLVCLIRRSGAAIRRRTESQDDAPASDINADFLMLWLLIFWVLMCSIDYAPSRYYVLFLPAFCGLAGLTLSDVSVFTFATQNRTMAFPLGLFGFHFAQSALHHLGVLGVFWPGLIGAIVFLLAWFRLGGKREIGFDQRLQAVSKALPAVGLMVWGIVNLYWTSDWLLHLTYRQRDADRWLATNLPANSVLIGAVTPGLSLNNRFVCVNVIEKLCNDQQPLEKFAPAPRYVLILDDRWREVWWQKHYPEVIAPERRIHEFRGLLRPFFVIGVYKVPDEMR